MDQQKVIEILSDAERFPGAPDSLEVRRTFESIIFLTADNVWRIRKADSVAGSDYQSPEARRLAAEADVQLNSGCAPGIYEQVQAIVPDGDDRVVFADADADGAVEYVTKMARIDDAAFLSARLARGDVSQEQLAGVIEALNQLHGTDEDVPQEAGSVDTLKMALEGAWQQVEPFVGRWMDESWLNWNRRFSSGFLERFESMITDRRGSHVAPGHGNLHAGHIAFVDDTPILLDRLVGADLMRSGDRARDIASLLVDIQFHNRHDISAAFVKALRSATPDDDRAALLPFYLSLAAFTRGRDSGLTATSSDVDDGARSEAADAASRYFQLAARYVLFGLEPILVAVCGPTGSGKSALIQEMGKQFGVTPHSSEQIRRGLAGSEPGSDIYSQDMTDRTYNTLIHFAARDAEQIGLGLADAQFLEPDSRSRLVNICRERGIRVCWIAIDPDRDLLEQRVADNERQKGRLATELELWRPPGADEADILLLTSGQESLQSAGDKLVRTHLDLLQGL